MAFFRNIFVDTLSANEGALSVEDLGDSNKITFRLSPEGLKYSLFGRRFDEITWTLIGETVSGNEFIDDLSWFDETSEPTAIEYKVEVEKNNPITASGYYTTNLGSV